MKKILAGALFIFLVLLWTKYVNAYCVACECTFVEYKKTLWSKGIYQVNKCYWDVELKDADYKTFEHFDWYARDKNNIYIYWEKKYKRLQQDTSFQRLYLDYFYEKDNIVYFKNKKWDLFEVLDDAKNFTLLHDWNWYFFIRNSKEMKRINNESYLEIGTERFVSLEYDCDISTLEYKNYTFFDKENVCWYNNVFPKKYLQLIDKKLKGYVRSKYRKSVKVNNYFRNKREWLYDKIYSIENKWRGRSNSFAYPKLTETEIKGLWTDRQLLWITEYMKEIIMCNPNDRIECADLFRRQYMPLKPKVY